MAKCDLCELKHYTPWYCQYEVPFKFTILDCDSCDTPMAVLGDHRAAPTEEDRAFITEALSPVARATYGADKRRTSDALRQNPDHCHVHVRPVRAWHYSRSHCALP